MMDTKWKMADFKPAYDYKEADDLAVIRALCWGPFAIHRPLDKSCKGWKLSHQQTGRQIMHGDSRVELKELARELVERGYDWDFTDPSQRPEAGAYLREWQDNH